MSIHSGRSWVGHDIEDACPCAQEPCGLVDLNNADPMCSEHSITGVKTMRQGHHVDDCPGLRGDR